MTNYLLAFLSSFFISIITIPIIIKYSRLYGFVAVPKEDRWHKKPTALLGGVGIFMSFMIPSLIFVPLNKLTIGILSCATAIFCLGLYDDLREIKPYSKIIFQIILTVILIYFGIKVLIIPYPYIAIPLTVFWIVGITNAFNILDNIDGLSCGIAFVSSVCIFLYAMQNNLPLVALFTAIISGSTIGFFIFNINPAKIFMGDCGSLFLGFLLSIVTILGTWQEATNLLFVVLAPIFFMAIPIFDTALVAFNRKSYGKNISQGGKDHSSHRLVFLGLSERRAVLILLGLSLLFGITVIFFSRLNFYTTLILLSVLAVCLLFFGIFLGGIKVYMEKSSRKPHRKSLIASVVLYKKQILQIVVDIVIINIAYISSYLLKYEGVLSPGDLRLIETSLPIIIVTKMVMFSVFGLYKAEWKYVGISDMIQVFKSVSLGSLVCMAILFILYRFVGYSRIVFINDYILTLLMIGGVRIMLRVFKEYFVTVADVKGKVPILIVGAGDGGELLLREIKNNPKINFKPIGFMDDDVRKKGRVIHGLKVLGSREDIPQIVKKNGIKKVLISIHSEKEDKIKTIYEICKNINVECERVRPLYEM